MNLLSEIISKPVLNLYTGKIEGTIKNVCFEKNYKKIKHLKMFDEEEEEYLIETTKIYDTGNNSIVVKNNEAMFLTISENDCLENNPINLNIYTTTGNYLGKLKDVELNNKFETQNFITENNEKINPSQILIVSQNIIVNTKDKQIKLCNLKPKIKVDKTNNKNIITIMPKQNQELKTIETPTIEDVPEENKTNETKQNFKIYNQPTPQKLIGNSNFLIGRKALKTIYGVNNEIIVKKDNIINAKNLDIAKKHSKLIELTVFSKIKA